jgi:hypothetical protein
MIVQTVPQHVPHCAFLHLLLYFIAIYTHASVSRVCGATRHLVSTLQRKWLLIIITPIMVWYRFRFPITTEQRTPTPTLRPHAGEFSSSSSSHIRTHIHRLLLLEQRERSTCPPNCLDHILWH